MKKTLLLLLLVGVLTLAIGSGVLAAEKPKLRIAAECTYPPFNYRDTTGELKGFDIDIAKTVCERIDAEYSFVCQEWDGLLPGLLAGKFDLIVASMSITPARQKQVDFSIPYRASTGRFVARKGAGINPFDKQGNPKPDALKGKILGAERGTTYDTYIATKFPGLERVLLYTGVHNLILDLKAGRLDIILGGPIKLYQDFLKQPGGEDYEFVGPELEQPELFGPGIGIAVRKGNEELLKKINAALEGIFADGTFKKINKKYWDFSVLPGAVKWD